jgi:hypothetical protein
MPDILANFAYLTTTSTSGASTPASGTSETWSVSALSSVWPALVLGRTMTIQDVASQSEIIRITASSGSGDTSITVTRGADGTTPLSHASGALFVCTAVSSLVNQLTEGGVFYDMGGASFNVMAYGATGNGTTDDTAAFNSALTAAAAVNGTVFVPPGTYKVSTSLTETTVPISIIGAGRWQTIIMWYGTGDVFRIYSSTNYSSRTKFGGMLAGLTIDGTNATGTSNGVHIGDVLQYRIDVAVQNFTTSGSYGVLFDNQYYWCEQMVGQIYASNCVTHVGFTMSGSSGTNAGSFERCDLSIYLDQENPAYDGVSLENGAYISNGFLRIKGNMAASGTSTTAACLRLTGASPVGSGSASISSIAYCMFDIGIECGSGSFYPFTIVLDLTNGTYVDACVGTMNFGDASTMQPCAQTGNIGFFGIVTGDVNLAVRGGVLATSPLWPQAGIQIGNYSGGDTISANGQTIDTGGISFVALEGSAAYTGLILQAGSVDGQLMFLCNYGSYPQTFAAYGTSNVADGIADVLAPYSSALFVWSFINSAWYRVTPAVVPGTLLQRVQFAPSSVTTYTLKASSTGLSALDTTNLKVVFTAPSTGAVMVKCQGWVKGGAAAATSVMFGVVSTTGSPGTLVGISGLVSLTPTTTAADNGELGVLSQIITGLTAGASYTWYFAASYSGTASTVLAQGGTGVTTVPTGAPAVMEVWAA